MLQWNTWKLFSEPGCICRHFFAPGAPCTGEMWNKMLKKSGAEFAFVKPITNPKPMQYLKNIAFTMLIRANGRIREFNFRKKSSAEKPFYEIDVSDEGGNRHYFTAAKVDDRWVLGEPNVPVWIKEAATSFHEVIEQQEPRISQHVS